MNPILLAQLKQEYGDIYSISLGGKEVFYRALSLKEIEYLESLAEDNTDLEDMYVSNAVVYPEDFDLNKIKAGFVSSLAEAIAEISGSGIEFVLKTLDDARSNAEQDVLVRVRAMILAAMPSYTEEYLYSLTMKQLLEKLVLAEEILTIQQVVRGIESTSGVRLELAPEESVEQPKQRKIPKVDKETLLRRIASEERQTINTALVPEVDFKALETLDEEILVKAAGFVYEDDPIARKLRKAMG